MSADSMKINSSVKNKRLEAQTASSSITKTIRIFEKCSQQKFLGILSSLLLFLYETSTVKIAVTKSLFLTYLAQACSFFFF